MTTTPFCAVYGQCGGCSLQHLADDDIAIFKQARVKQALEKKNMVVEVQEKQNAHGKGRIRTTLHLENGNIGFKGKRSHDLIAIDHCPLLEARLNKAFPSLKQLPLKIADCHLTLAENGVDLSLQSEQKISESLRQKLLQGLQDFVRVSYNNELLYQQNPPYIKIETVEILLPQRSFLQATALSAQMIADYVIAHKGKAKEGLDLFCGLGTITLPLAKSMRLAAVDNDEKAISALQHTLKNTQGLKPVTAFTRDLFRSPLLPFELKKADLVVLDPPRAGAEKLCLEIVKSIVPQVIMISCNPDSFARDAAILVQGGFEIENVTPIDQFAYSDHVEVASSFKRKK